MNKVKQSLEQVLPSKPLTKKPLAKAILELDEKIEEGIGRASTLNKTEFD